MMSLKPIEEDVGVSPVYNWSLPLNGEARPCRKVRSVWYVALPLTSAHRGGHSGGGKAIDGVGGQERYANEGTVYPHAALIEMITYQERCFPGTSWRYIDMSHELWAEVRAQIQEAPPDVLALSVYSATALWALIVAAEVKRVNPRAIVIMGNDHAGILNHEILTGRYGSRVVDFVATGNNAPWTMMGLLYALEERLPLEKVPSIAYRRGDSVVNQSAATYPLNLRILPDYRLIEPYLQRHYDEAFAVWYSHHYELKRMVTLPLDSGCNWGRNPRRRCKHCSIQGLTPKVAELGAIVSTLETVVGQLGANVYAAGDSTLGFSRSQWGGEMSYLDDLAEACSRSPVLRSHRFMLMYGLVTEFPHVAELCSRFVRTWNVGVEAFDPKLLRGDSKGINRGAAEVYESFELARKYDYRLYVSGILGLPGTTLAALRSEVDRWLALAEAYSDIITTISVAAPAVIPGSRMYWESHRDWPEVRAWHGEAVPSRPLTELYLTRSTEVKLADVEAAINEVGRGVIGIGQRGGGMKFGGYMMGGKDNEEAMERALLDDIAASLQ